MPEVHEIVPPRGDYFSYVTRVVDCAFRLASFIIGAITYALQKLQLYSKVPPNGQLIYTETVVRQFPWRLPLFQWILKKEVSIDFGDSLRLLDKFHGVYYVCENDKNIARSNIKEVIKALEDGKGKEGSLIVFVMPSDDEISKLIKVLDYSAQKYKNAIGAISVVKRMLKKYSKPPANGLVMCAGTVDTDDGRGKDVTFKFEPLKSIYCSTRRIIDRFDWAYDGVTDLTRVLEPEYGFIVMVDKRALFGTLSGTTKKILHEFTVDPPYNFSLSEQTHERQLRRCEFRNEYLERVVNLAIEFYKYSYTTKLIVAVSPDYQTDLTNRLHGRLKKKEIIVVGASYGGKIGFDYAIGLMSKRLCNVRYIQEMKLIEKFFKKLTQKPRKFALGVKNTLKCLEMGAIEILIVWENLDINRYVLKNTQTGERIIKHLNKEQETHQSNFQDSETNAKLDILEKISLVDWLKEYKKFEYTLEFVSDSSQQGSQFCKALKGIGGILKYALDVHPEMSSDDNSDDGDPFDDNSDDGDPLDDNSDDGDQLPSFHLFD